MYGFLCSHNHLLHKDFGPKRNKNLPRLWEFFVGFALTAFLLDVALQVTFRHNGWRCRRSRVAEKPASPWLLSSRSWWCAGSWRTTSASTTRTTTVWRVSPGSDPRTRITRCHVGIYTCVCFSNLSGAYEWAQKTLKDHAKDKREYIYTREQLQKAKTHDKLWNAAQACAFPPASCCLAAASSSRSWVDWTSTAETLLSCVWWSVRAVTLLFLFYGPEASRAFAWRKVFR